MRSTLSTIVTFLVLLLIYLAVFLFSLWLTMYRTSAPRHSPGPDYWREALPEEYRNLLSKNGNKFFLLEPQLLSKIYAIQGTFSEMEEKEKAKVLQWRFDLPVHWNWTHDSLTIGIFAQDLRMNTAQTLDLARFKEIYRVTGASNPFHRKTQSGILHVFYDSIQADQSKLHLHLVVLHPVKNFLWIGSISNETFSQLNPNPMYFGALYEQIFDPFEVTLIDGLQVPNSIGHLLSQLPTSRYLHCGTSRNTKWLSKYNQSQSVLSETLSLESLIAMKGLAKEAQIQFWLASGSLLGWTRQCSVIPDTEWAHFATWSKYIVYSWTMFTQNLNKSATKNDLKLSLVQGLPGSSVQYTFQFTPRFEQWKIGLFVNYANETHFRYALHGKGGKLTYQSWPKFTLCSVALLGYKVLAPCTAKDVVAHEYGAKWRRPIKKWNYQRSPRNKDGSRVWPLMTKGRML